MAGVAQLRFTVEGGREVSALLLRPVQARHLLVLAHGAGAGMSHSFMEKLADELASVGVATFRYQFPYMEERRRVLDTPTVLTATVVAAVRTVCGGSSWLAVVGGRQVNGRTDDFARCGTASTGWGARIGIFWFPLHPPNRPGTKRADHLAKVSVPILFMQGTRDTLADLKLLRPICAKLGSRATLHIFEKADHSFHVLKSSGRSDAEVLRELAETASSWAEAIDEKQSKLAQNPTGAEPAQTRSRN